MITLYQAVTRHLAYQRDKHDLDTTYVEDTINNMANIELLEAISNGIEWGMNEGMIE